jgi:hypothetical protein
MATDEDMGAELHEVIVLLIFAIISLLAGFTIGIVGGNMYHVSRLAAFLFSFGISFAIFLLLFVVRTAMAFLGRP